MGVAREASPRAARGTRSPFLIAHRAGNDLDRARDLRLPPGSLIEADLRLRNDTVEVRHLKAAWPLPLLWDRWRLAAGWRPRLSLDQLLDAAPADVELVLDLKGRRARLATLVRAAIVSRLPERRLTVCARHWPMLDVVRDLPVRRVHSVGSARQLERLLSRHPHERLDGVSIHERLLDAHAVRALRNRAETIMTWPVNAPERARELLRLGVDGLITDVPAAIAPCVTGAPA
jgi:hypothetical protein